MQVNLNAGNTHSTSFKQAYSIGVYLNGKYYGQKQKDTLYKVATALTTGMKNRSLPSKVNDAVKKFFPDFIDNPFVTIGRSYDKLYPHRTCILTSFDAQEYINVYLSSGDRREKMEIGAWTLDKIMRRRGNKKLIISAEEKDGKITINDISANR